MLSAVTDLLTYSEFEFIEIFDDNLIKSFIMQQCSIVITHHTTKEYRDDTFKNIWEPSNNGIMR